MDVKDYINSKEAELIPVIDKREYPFPPLRQDDLRLNSDIDYARVLYSSSFRRLQGKMQLFIPKSLNFYRNRLTHSLEVAQIARSLAIRLGLRDTQTVQTCSLAHDIGNPPFGHAGEIFLSNCSETLSFEGNAQTFRTLTHIEEKHHAYNGLNLTIRTLLGVVKYPNTKDQNAEKFIYDEDFIKVKAWSDEFNLSLRTIDCEIIDLADEIAYAVHDLEDSLRLKFFTIGELLYEFKQSKYTNAYDKLTEIVSDARSFANKSSSYESSEEYSILFKKELTSLLVDILITDIGLIEDSGIFKLGYKTLKDLSKGLKTLTFKAIKRSPVILEYELQGKQILKGLYEVYMDTSFNKDLVLLPAEYRDKNNKERTILDYIGGMMDEYAILQYKKFYGERSLDGIFRKF